MSHQQQSPQPFAAVINLGCVKNLVDSEVLLHQLTLAGFQLTAEPARAEVLVVNTCGFLESAVSEAIDTLLEAAGHKQTGACRRLVAVGCMVQRYGKKLPQLLPEVDLFIGTSFYQQFGRILRAHLDGDPRRVWISRPKQNSDRRPDRIQATPFYSAYVKIAEGCSNQCTFCMIPKLRGPYRSRTIDDIAGEVEELVAAGVREVNLVAQDTSRFGLDRDRPGSLARLLERLDQVRDLAWVRILYTHPRQVTDDLLQTLAASAKVVPYLDIPLQHCVPKVLRAMLREDAHPDPRRLLATIREAIPGVAIRTSLMVGFPGETADDFNHLLAFVEEVQFDHLGVFAFSAEPGSRAARLADRVPNAVGEHRRTELMALQQRISRDRLRRYPGTVQPVLVEGPHPETELLVQGRMPTQAPEVDGVVLITEGELEIGRITPVRITAAHDYDLEGTPVLNPSTGPYHRFGPFE